MGERARDGGRAAETRRGTGVSRRGGWRGWGAGSWQWLFLLAVVAFALLGVRPLWDPDEGRYGVVALRMLRGGDWLTPTLHHEVVHFTKPPLAYWAMAAACAVLGPSELALRLPSALAFAATVLLVGRIARRLMPGREITAAAVQATSLLPFVAACVATTDSLLAFWVTLALAAWVELRWANAGARARWVFWLALAGAFLTKGPPGLLPLVAVLVLAVWERRVPTPRALTAGIAAAGPIAAAAVVALAWFAFQAAHHPNLSAYWLRDEVVGRIATSEHHRNAGLIGLLGVYVPVVLVGAQPWLPLALSRRGSGSAIDPAAKRLLWTWLLAPGTIFALADSRLPLYLLPLAPPASLLLAGRLPADWGRRGRALLGLWIAALLALRAGSTAFPVGAQADGERFARQLAGVLPQPPGELVFVDQRPHYSLAFYLDTEVEWVRLESPAADNEHTFAPLWDSLADELGEPEAGRYFLTDRERAASFLDALRARGYAARRLGSVGRFAVFDEPRASGAATAARAAPGTR